MPKTEPLYAIREIQERPAYAVTHPTLGEIVANDSFANGYCAQPITATQERAQEIAKALTASTKVEWQIERAPNPCARCGRVIWADDLDFLYPQNRERTSWRAGCNLHDFGCGHEVVAESKDSVLARWNND